MRFRRFVIAACIVFGTVATLEAGSRAQAASVEFSPLVPTLERVVYLMWNPFQRDFSEKALKMSAQRIAPNGNTELLDGSGNVAWRLRIASTVNAEATQRYVLFEFLNPGNNGFVIEIKTEGRALVAPPIDEVRVGHLPFFPKGRNERRSIVTLGLPSDPILFFEFVNEGDENESYLSLWAHDRLGQTIFTGREYSTPVQRELVYDLSDQWFEGGGSLRARRLKTEGMMIGSEEFFIDGARTSFSEFLDRAATVQEFAATILRI